MSRRTLIYAIVRAAKLRATELANGTTPKGILEGIILGKFTAEVTDGKTVVSTTVGEQSVSFHVPNDLGPSDILELAESAIQHLEAQENPEDPDLIRRPIKSLKVRIR